MADNFYMSRREMLLRSAFGFGTISTLSLSSVQNTLGALAEAPHPLAAKAPHFTPRAQRVIFLYQTGGVSHIDTFDPKEKLNADHGKTYGDRGKKLRGSNWEAHPYGRNGTMVTTLFPNICKAIDDICLIRSMWGDQDGHLQADVQMHTGSNGSAIMPGIGAWLSYALGTQNVDLPSHVVFCKSLPYGGGQEWDSYFLPSYHQGVVIKPSDDPIPNLSPYRKTDLQEKELQMLHKINERHLLSRREMVDLKARMLAFKTAYSMQSIVPDLFDLGDESDATLQLYGVEPGDTESYAWQCLMARRMAEKGVRFIELVDSGGAGGNWDQHSRLEQHERQARIIDQPTAALIQDLKLRGMYDDTLIVWCTEFGRTPTGESGREHHAKVFSCWLAGGAVEGGLVYGASDDIGWDVAENPVHINDFHATILHIMGLDHLKLTYKYAGRDFRLTDVGGNVVHDLLA